MCVLSFVGTLPSIGPSIHQFYLKTGRILHNLNESEDSLMLLKTLTKLTILPLLWASSQVSAAEPTKEEICQQWANLHANYTEPSLVPQLLPPLYLEDKDSCTYYLEGPRVSLYECAVPYSDVLLYTKLFNNLSPAEKADPNAVLKQFVMEKITSPLCPKR